MAQPSGVPRRDKRCRGWNEPKPKNEPGLADLLASEDVCPRCLGELDTGWECNDCGYDAQPHINAKENTP